MNLATIASPPDSNSCDLRSTMQISKLTMRVMGGWQPTRLSGKGVGKASRKKTVKDWKGGELKRVAEGDDSMAENLWVRRLKMAIWYMNFVGGSSLFVPFSTRIP